MQCLELEARATLSSVTVSSDLADLASSRTTQHRMALCTTTLLPAVWNAAGGSQSNIKQYYGL